MFCTLIRKQKKKRDFWIGKVARIMILSDTVVSYTHTNILTYSAFLFVFQFPS